MGSDAGPIAYLVKVNAIFLDEPWNSRQEVEQELAFIRWVPEWLLLLAYAFLPGFQRSPF